jgi:hypothetical protein
VVPDRVQPRFSATTQALKSPYFSGEQLRTKSIQPGTVRSVQATSTRRHPVRSRKHLIAALEQALEIVPLVGDAPHPRMVIAPAEEPQEVGAAEDNPAAWGANADRLSDEGLRILHVFHHVQCADPLEMTVGVGKLVAIIQQASVGEGSGALDVRP